MHCLQAIVEPYGPRLPAPIPGIRSPSKWERVCESRSSLSPSRSLSPSLPSPPLLAGCGPPITQDCITTVKSHPSPGVSGVKLHRPDGDALPRASDARRCSVMGGRRIGGVEEWRGRRRAGPSGRKRGAAAEGGTAARTCRLNNFALRSKNVALGGGWVGGWEGRESDRFFKRGTWPGLGAKRGGRG